MLVLSGTVINQCRALIILVSYSLLQRSGSAISRHMSTNIISCVDPLGFPFKTADPFVFCVYHKDNYPAGDDKMQAPSKSFMTDLLDFNRFSDSFGPAGKGNGADFNPQAPYRMYHGDRIPGFPQHPHRGFEVRNLDLGVFQHPR